MKKVIASILSLALLSGLFVNPSFAEEIQSTKVAQEKASNIQLNQPGLTAQEKAAEKLKSDLKKYNEKQQKLIQKYENMTDKEFRWDKVKKFLMKAFFALVCTGFVSGTYLYMSKKMTDERKAGREAGEKVGYDFGYDLGHKTGYYFGRQAGYDEGERDGRKFGEFDCIVKHHFQDPKECIDRAKAKKVVNKILAFLHPDVFSKKGKNFDDVKEVYYNLTNFYDKYLK